MQPVWRHQLLIVALTGTVLFLNLGGARLWDRDEPRNAGCAAEMLERNDWVVPMFNAELREHKPVLLYWFMMAAYGMFGVGEFGARFFSALFGVGTALATYHIGRRLFNATTGLWAAVILSTALMFDVAGRAATPDSVLIFFATLATMVYVLWAFPRNDPAAPPAAESPSPGAISYFPAAWPVVVLMYALMGVATLAKGPVGMILPTAVIGMFLLVMRLPARAPDAGTPAWRRWLAACVRPFAPRHFLATCWSMRLLTATVVVLAVSLPWYIWVGLRTDGAWLKGFFLTHHLHRATHSMEGHGGPIIYYVGALMLGFLPWSLLLVPSLIDAVRRIRRGDGWRPGLVFAACWVGVYLGIFSLARTKLPSYITPAYPAVALLAACYVYHLSRSTALVSRRWAGAGATAFAVMGLAIVVGLPVAASRVLPGKEWLGVVGLIPMLGAGLCWVLLRRNRPQGASVSYAATATVFSLAVFALAAPRVDEDRRDLELLDTVAARSPRPPVFAYGALEPSWVFYSGHPINEMRSVQPPEVSAKLAEAEDACLLTTEECYDKLRPTLSPELQILARRPRFLRRGQMLLIGKPGAEDVLEARASRRGTELR